MIMEYFSKAELALASYANLSPGIPNTTALHDDGKGMSAAQAANFADRYTVVTQYNDTETSFSATVFKDASGNLTLAIRGTLELAGSPSDLPTDIDIWQRGAGYDQIVALYNWWQRESTPAGQEVPQYSLTTLLDGVSIVPSGAVELYRVEGNGPVPIDRVTYLVPSDTVQATGGLVQALSADGDGLVDVTGHSLGGHLAMSFGALFPDVADQITVFNAPGFIDNTTNQNFFGALGGSVPSGTNTTNVIADEADVSDTPWSAIAGLHSRPGVAIDIPIENQWLSDEPDSPAALNHSQQTLTDALAVYATLSELDPSLTPEAFKGILAGAASGTAGGLEGVVDTLEELFGINTSTLPIGNAHRNDVYQALYGLNDSVLFTQDSGIVTVQTLTGKTTTELAALATTDIAYRYALVNLDPFVITGDEGVYAQHNANGELALYDPQTGQGHLTTEYLNDRAAYLVTQLEFNTSGESIIGPQAIEYHDLSSRTMVTVTATSGTTRRIVFGSDGNDALTHGGSEADHLYGGKGDDLLEGKGGADYLEGGEGFDIYRAGDGDTLFDFDGEGRVLFDGVLLQGGRLQQDGTYRSDDGAFIYRLDNNVLAVTGPGGELTIKHFTSGDMGIELGDESLEPGETNFTIHGDLTPKDFDPASSGIQTQTDELDNVITTNELDIDREDTLYDSEGNDAIYGYGGDDYINAWRGGDDYIQAGNGQDETGDMTWNAAA